MEDEMLEMECECEECFYARREPVEEDEPEAAIFDYDAYVDRALLNLERSYRRLEQKVNQLSWR